MASMLPTWSLSTNDSVAPRATSTTLPTAPAKQQQLRTRRFGNATASSSTPVSRSKHVHFAWRSVQDVNYLRACADNAATGTVTVYHCVNGTSELWQTHLLLKTDGALAALRRPERNGTRCLRYENRGCCADGPRCAYIHVITLDPSLTTEAKRRVRPNQQQQQPTSTTAQQPPNEQPLQRTSLPQWQSCVKKSALTPFGGRADDSDDDDEDDYFMATVDESSRPITVERSQTHLDVPSFSACLAPSERSVALCTVSRTTVWWRHDPYSSEATRVQCCTPANA